MKAIPERRVETDILAKRLQDMQPGEVVAYQDLSRMIGMDVQNGARGLLYSAMRIAQTEKHCCYATVRGVGIKRLLPSAVHTIGAEARESFRRRSRRVLQKMLLVTKEEYDGLSDEERTKIDLERTVMSFVSASVASKQVKKLEVIVKNSGGEAPLQKTLEMFK